MTRKPYPSDLTDAQWEELVPLLPPAKLGGHPRTVDLREVTNGILYVLRSGCSWRMLPHDFPRPGAQCGGASAAGGRRVSGNRSMRPCAPKSGQRREGNLVPAPQSLTARV